MAAGKFFLFEQAAYSAQRILNATVFSFNSTVETATIGISAAFLNNGQYVDQITGKVLTGQRAMNAAVSDARSVIEQLRASNMVTIATLDQLIKSYQETAPVALNRGFNKDQVEQFTVAMMQAAGAVDTTGMLINQMGEETRSLLNGGISDKNTRIATALGIRNEDVERYKGDVQGLFDFLMSKLAAYQAFGDQLQKTWKGVASNTVDIFQQMSAQATEPIFVAVRDGLYEWTKGIASVDQETKKLKWNPDYLSGVESVRKEVNEFISLLKAHGPSFSKNFESMSSAAGGSAKAVKEVSLAVLGIYDAGEKLAGWGAWEWGLVGYALFKGGPQAAAIVATLNTVNGLLGSISGSNIGAIHGQFADMQSSARNFGQTLSESFSGLRDWNTGDLISTDGVSVRVDQITREIGKLQTSIASMEGSNGAVGGLVASLISPVSVEEAKARIASLKNEKDDLKKTTTDSSVYQPNKNTVISDEWNKGREKFLASLQTEREKALADYEEQKQYVKTVEEGQKLRAQLSEKLASIDSKAAKSSQAAGLKAERSALKELNAEITGYTAEARAAADAALDWHRSALDALDGITRLNDQVSMNGFGEFGRIAQDAAFAIREGAKEIEAYQKALASADLQISATGAAYDTANERLNKAKEALGANGAGSSTEDANKVRALEKEVESLSLSLKEQTTDYYNLEEAQKRAIKTVDDLKATIADQSAFDANMSAYSQLGVVSQQFFSRIQEREEGERDAFIRLTGDKETAGRLFYERMLEYRKALAAKDFEQSGDMTGLLKTGLEQASVSANRDAIDFYSDLLPDAIGGSADTLSQFFRDTAQGNARLSNSWRALGETIEDVVFGMLQNISQLALKMALTGAMSSMFGFPTGSTSGGTGNYGVGVTGGARHSGGTIGVDAPTFTRIVPESTFAHAPRYHTGLMTDEYASILKRGESVLTKGQMKAIGAGLSAANGSPNVKVTVIEAPGVKAETETKQGQDGGLEMVVRMVESKISDRMGRGQGLHKTMGSLYGARRKF